MDLGLKGRKAIITGGSKGIGRAIANLLADEGCNVGICARNAEEVDAAVAALKAKGVNAYGSAIDVRDGDAVRKWVSDCAEALGGLDIVVPNVSALAIERNEDSWRAQFEVDLLHTVNAVEAALPILEKSDAGSIVIISSVSGVEIDFAADIEHANNVVLPLILTAKRERGAAIIKNYDTAQAVTQRI